MATAGSDNFATATALPYGSISDPTPTAALTTEVDEPDEYGIGSNLRSAWWKFTAPASETVGLDLFSSIVTGDLDDADPFIVIWTGTDLASLTYVADGDDSSWTSVHHWLTEFEFDATEGTTYYIQACLYDYSDDIEYVLRMGKRITTTGDWIQDDDRTDTYDLDDASKWSTHDKTQAWSEDSSFFDPTLGTLDDDLDASYQANVTALNDAPTITTSSPASYMAGTVGAIQSGATYQCSTSATATFEVFVPSVFPPSTGVAAPDNPDASSFEIEGTGETTLISFTLDAWDALWRTWLQWETSGPTNNVDHPDYAGTIEYSVLTGDISVNPSDKTTWNMADKSVFETWDFASNDQHKTGGPYDITDGVLPWGGAFIIMRLPKALGAFPGGHPPGVTYPTTLFADAENNGTPYPTPFDPPVGDTRTVTYVTRPARYRYIFKDVELVSTGINGSVGPQRTRFIPPR